MKFKPEIQGLRAIAVSTVLIFHVWPGVLPGGYVGVDVFFVISGYLITGLLFREFEATGRIDLPAFYGARARRLLPAAAVVLVSVAACAPLLPSVRWSSIGSEIVASAMYYQNWWLAFEAVNYLAEDYSPSILLHFWSLSVEEQYYLVWPLLLSVAVSLSHTKRDPVRPFVVIIGLLFIVSMAYSIYLTPRNPSLAYFATTTRAWELALGGLLAVLGRSKSLPNNGKEIAVVAGILMILYAAFAFDGDTAFPGYAALLPTFGAVLVIAGASTGAKFSPNAALSSAPFQYLGSISYSLYLWHWPVIIIYRQLAERDLELVDGLVVIAVSCALAHQTKYLVEDRFRAKRGALPLRGAAFVGSFSVLAAVAAGVFLASAAGRNQGPLPTIASTSYPGALALTQGLDVEDPLLPYIPSARTARNDQSDAYGRCIASDGESEPQYCEYGSRDAEFQIAVVGDSHAVHWFPAFKELAKEQNWRVTGIAKSACSFGTHPVTNRSGAEAEDCTLWSEKVQAVLLERNFDMVVFAQSIGHMAVDAGSKDESAALIGVGLASSWKQLVARGTRIVAIKDTPWMSKDVPDCMSAPVVVEDECARPRSTAIDFRRDPLKVAAGITPGVTLLDLNNAICGSKICAPVVGNILVWRDRHHLTATYARSMAPILLDLIRRAREDPSSHEMTVEALSAPRAEPHVRQPGSSVLVGIPQLSLDHELEYDRVGKTIHGDRQRQVFILVKNLESEMIRGALISEMKRSGYAVAAEEPSQRGLRVDFSKKGEPLLSAHIRSVAGKAGDSVTGAIYFTRILPD